MKKSTAFVSVFSGLALALVLANVASKPAIAETSSGSMIEVGAANPNVRSAVYIILADVPEIPGAPVPIETAPPAPVIVHEDFLTGVITAVRLTGSAFPAGAGVGGQVGFQFAEGQLELGINGDVGAVFSSGMNAGLSGGGYIRLTPIAGRKANRVYINGHANVVYSFNGNAVSVVPGVGIGFEFEGGQFIEISGEFVPGSAVVPLIHAGQRF